MIEIRRRISTPFWGVSSIPATVADPELGAMSVPSTRTVVVFPAPLGPRNPKTSPFPTSKETSSKASRPSNRFDRWLTEIAVSMPGPAPREGQSTIVWLCSRMNCWT